MRRDALFGFLAVILTLLFGASVSAQVAIEFSGWPNDDRVGPIVERFHAAHPDVHVDVARENPQQVLVRILGGLPPDVFRVSWAEFADFVDAGTVIDLTPYLERDRTELEIDDLWPPVLRSGQYKGRQYGMPMNVGGNLVFVNLDHVNEAGLALNAKGWTYVDFADLAQRTTRDLSGDGAPDRWGYANVNFWSFWAGLIHSNGGSLWNEDWTAFQTDTPVVVEAIRYIDDLVNRRLASPGPGQPKPNLASGNATFWLGSAPSVFTIGQDTGFAWTVAPNPSGSVRRVMMGGNQPVLISNATTSEEREAAWKLIKFMMSTEVQAWLGNAGFNAPMRISAIPYIENEHIRTYAMQLENQVEYTNRMHSQINQTFNQYLNQVLSGEVAAEGAAALIQHDLNVQLDAALRR